MSHECIDGEAARGILVIADHASNAVPGDISLGIPDALLNAHVALDIGTGDLARSLAARLGAPAIIAAWSRLVVDLNRTPAEAIAASSDGHAIPGNAGLDDAGHAARIARFHKPYHAAISAALDGVRLIVSVHSFTPTLASRPEEARPWQVGLLYNRNCAAARIAMRHLAKEGLTIGDNLPYSGTVYGYTTDRHAEATGIDYLTFEIRQDLLATDADIRGWTDRLTRVIGRVEAEMFSDEEAAIS